MATPHLGPHPWIYRRVIPRGHLDYLDAKAVQGDVITLIKKRAVGGLFRPGSVEYMGVLTKDGQMSLTHKYSGKKDAYVPVRWPREIEIEPGRRTPTKVVMKPGAQRGSTIV